MSFKIIRNFKAQMPAISDKGKSPKLPTGMAALCAKLESTALITSAKITVRDYFFATV